MSATVFGSPRYGIIDDSAATGMKLANLAYSYSTEKAVAADHLGCDSAVAYYNDKAEVSFDGVVATKASGLGLTLADVIVLLNEDDDSLSLNDSALFSTTDANAGTIISTLSLTRTNREFETGNGTAEFHPLVATNSPTTLT